MTTQPPTPKSPSTRRLTLQALVGLAAMCALLLLVAGSEWVWFARAIGAGVAGGLVIVAALSFAQRRRTTTSHR
jgi:hypothetical protein